MKKYLKSLNQKGMTLVSLIVGMGLSAFLIMVMLQVFATSKANHKLAENLAEMNDTLRYVTVTMTDLIGYAGYRVPPAAGSDFRSYNSVFTSDYSGTVVSNDTNNRWTAREVNLGDRFWIKLEGSNEGFIRDCEGTRINASDGAVKVKFYARERGGGYSGQEGVSLLCERAVDGLSYDYDSQGVMLIPSYNFESMWVRYGEDTNNDGVIDRWVTHEASGFRRDRVYAMRIAIMIHSRDELLRDSITRNFTIFGEPYTYSSRRIFKLHVFTVNMPYAPRCGVTMSC